MPTIINGDGVVTAGGTASTQGKVVLAERTGSGTNTVTIQAPATLAADLTFTMPTADGTNGQVLQTNGSGVLSFGTPASTAIGTVQYYTGNTAPDASWLLCDGSFVSQATYPTLYSTIGLKTNGPGTWTNRVTGTSENLMSAAFGAGVFVMVGDSGGIYSSTDGVTWLQRSTTTIGYRKIIFANSQFVAVGNSGRIVTSPNGTTWTVRTSGTNQQLLSVAFGSGLYVAVGQGGVILTSPDGITWTSRTSGTSGPLYGIAFGNSIWVAVGDQFLTSSNATTWTNIGGNPTGYQVPDLTFGNGLFVTAAGNATAWYSSNGTSWTSVGISVSNPYGCYFDGTRYVIVGNSGGLITSTNATTWTSRTTGLGGNIFGFTFSPSRYLITANSGETSYSADTVTWTANFLNSAFNGAAFGNGVYVVAGDRNVIYSSADGTTWTLRTTPNNDSLRYITFGNNLFVAVGSLSGGAGYILTSPDGVTWTSRTNPASTVLLFVAYLNNQFVAVGGSGTILTSPDGVTWTARTSGSSGTLTFAAYGNGAYVVPTGSSASVLVSSDAVTWTTVTTGLAGNSNSVAFGNGTFVLGGSSGSVSTSTDGYVWTSRTTGISVSLNFIFFYNNQFMAGTGTGFFTSTDGVNWTITNTGIGTSAYATNGTLLVSASSTRTISTANLYRYDTSTQFMLPSPSIGGVSNARPYVKAL